MPGCTARSATRSGATSHGPANPRRRSIQPHRVTASSDPLLQPTRTQQNGAQMLECHAPQEFGAWHRAQAHFQPRGPVRAPADRVRKCEEIRRAPAGVTGSFTLLRPFWPRLLRKTRRCGAGAATGAGIPYPRHRRCTGFGRPPPSAARAIHRHQASRNPGARH